MSKNYDATFKSLADDDPRALLFLFAGVPLEAEIAIEALPREVTAPALQVDHAFRIRSEAREWIWHIELMTHYRSQVPERMVRYGAALCQKYPSLDLECTLVVLAEESAPRTIASRHEIRRGGFYMGLDYKVIELWKVEAGAALSAGRASLLPWVTLMKASEQQLAAAMRQVILADDTKLSAQSVILGALRYDKDYIAELLGRIGNMIWLTEDVLRHSGATKDILLKVEQEAAARGEARGVAEGVERGVSQGRIYELRRGIRLLVSRKFPALGDLPDLDRVGDTERLEELLLRIGMAGSVEEAESAVRQIS